MTGTIPRVSQGIGCDLADLAAHLVLAYLAECPYDRFVEVSGHIVHHKEKFCSRCGVHALGPVSFIIIAVCIVITVSICTLTVEKSAFPWQNYGSTMPEA